MVMHMVSMTELHCNSSAVPNIIMFYVKGSQFFENAFTKRVNLDKTCLFGCFCMVKTSDLLL